MSADGAGIIGAAVLALAAAPVLIAGATIVGAVYGTTKLIEHASNNRQKSESIRREQERQRTTELARKSEEERRKINEVISIFNTMQSRQAESRRRLNQRFASELSIAASEVEENQRNANANIVKLLNEFEDKSCQLLSSWQQSSEQLQDTYYSSISDTISRIKQTVEQRKNEITTIQKQFQEDNKKGLYAKEQIEKAKAALDTIKLEFDIINNTLLHELNQAIEYYNQGMFDNAYSIASNVTLRCYDELAEGLVQREKTFALLDIIETKLILERSKIASLKHFTFDYKDETYEEDLTRFSPEVFSAISGRLSDIEIILTNPDLSTLIGISHELDEISDDIKELIKLSATKLLYAYTENDTAADISSAMKSQGFEMVGYAYEHNVEGNSIHINYLNSISGEKVTVVLTPSSDGIKVNVHNFGTNSISGQEDPIRQDSIRKKKKKTLNIQISCTNRGRSSTNTSAANLDEVKRLS